MFLEVDVSILVNKPTTLILIYVAMYNRLLFCEVNLFKHAIATCPSVILIIRIVLIQKIKVMFLNGSKVLLIFQLS